jgi:GT2 family glycosyltransferase
MPLSPGDRLSETALYRIAVEAAARPSLAIIYGDEIRPQGEQPGGRPWFKPDFDLDRMLGSDLFGHAAAYRPALLSDGAMPGAAPGDWYGAGLRAALAAGRDRIGHLPVLLCEQPADAPPPAAADAVAEALSAQGIAAEVRSLPPDGAGWRRIIWPLPAVPPLVSVIVPTRDRAALLAACAEGVLERTDYPAIEFLIVDNGSTEAATHALFSRLRSDPRVRILPAPGPFNYSALNNHAAAEARGEVLLLLNNDIEVMADDWLRELVSHSVRPDVGAVGAKLLYADGTLQHGGVITGVGGAADHYRLGVAREDTGYFGSLAMVREVAAATGACLALRRSVFEAVGGLDEANLAVAFNDVDFCLRIRAAGWRILWTPFAELYHLESASRGQDLTAEKAQRFARELGYLRRHWGKALMRDPFYNPNLELDGAADALAAVPRHQPPWAPFRQRKVAWSFR